MIAFGDTKVVNPSPKVLAQLKKLVVHGHAPVAVRESPDLLFKRVQRVRMPVNLASFKCESKELAFIGLNDVAFDRVNDQFQTVLQEPTDTLKHSLPAR